MNGDLEDATASKEDGSGLLRVDLGKAYGQDKAHHEKAADGDGGGDDVEPAEEDDEEWVQSVRPLCLLSSLESRHPEEAYGDRRIWLDLPNRSTKA